MYSWRRRQAERQGSAEGPGVLQEQNPYARVRFPPAPLKYKIQK